MSDRKPDPRVPWHLLSPVEQHVEMDRHLVALQEREREVRLAERLRREQQQPKEVIEQ